MDSKIELISVVFMVFIIFFVTIPISSAVNTCFLYDESPYYCKDISEAAAKEECTLYGCDVNKAQSKQSCFSLSFNQSCSTITCKSTCTQTRARDCPSGAVPSGQESVWCNRGCCEYVQEDSRTCGAESNRYICEQKATAGGRVIFYPTNEPCVNLCKEKLPGQEIMLASNAIVPPQNQGISLWPFFLLLPAVAFVVWFYFKNKKTHLPKRQEDNFAMKSNLQDNQELNYQKSKNSLLSTHSSLESAAKQSHKSEQIKRFEVLRRFGPIQSDTFAKLKKLLPKPKIEQKPFEKLNAITNNKPVSPERTKPKHDSILTDLRKLGRKQFLSSLFDLLFLGTFINKKSFILPR